MSTNTKKIPKAWIRPYARTFDFDGFMKTLKKAFESYKNVPIITLIASQDRSPFQVLIGTILSARTKDETTAQACTRLFKQAPTLNKMAVLSESQIEKLIYPVGFSKTKAKHIKATTSLLLTEHNGRVPDTMDTLLTLPGVGRKTANLVLGEAFKKQAICVDTHVHRISNLLGLLKTKTPHETEQALAEVLPKKHWILYNTYLVAHGQTVCRPTSPKCSECQIGEFCRRVGVTRSR